MESHSCGSQDVFAWTVLGKPSQGTFVDIGSCFPIQGNNTYMLEKNGFNGLSFDIMDMSHQYSMNRSTRFIQADAKTYDIRYSMREYFGNQKIIDYLTFDVDDDGIQCLRNMPLDEYEFKVMTVEHDSYRLGDTQKTQMREILSKDYKLICSNVSIDGNIYEDWWINPKYIHIDVMCPDGMPHQDILKYV
jgi:hypothetical protein